MMLLVLLPQSADGGGGASISVGFGVNTRNVHIPYAPMMRHNPGPPPPRVAHWEPRDPVDEPQPAQPQTPAVWVRYDDKPQPAATR
jgi:hypothetical protein